MRFESAINKLIDNSEAFNEVLRKVWYKVTEPLTYNSDEVLDQNSQKAAIALFLEHLYPDSEKMQHRYSEKCATQPLPQKASFEQTAKRILDIVDEDSDGSGIVTKFLHNASYKMEELLRDARLDEEKLNAAVEKFNNSIPEATTEHPTPAPTGHE